MSSPMYRAGNGSFGSAGTWVMTDWQGQSSTETGGSFVPHMDCSLLGPRMKVDTLATLVSTVPAK